MKSVSTDSNRVVSFGEKVSYGITEIACNPMYTIFCSFLVFFYTDVIGVNAAARRYDHSDQPYFRRFQ